MKQEFQVSAGRGSCPEIWAVSQLSAQAPWDFLALGTRLESIHGCGMGQKTWLAGGRELLVGHRDRQALCCDTLSPPPIFF